MCVCMWVCTGVDELQGHVEELRKAVQERSEEIVRLLLSRDRRQRRLELNFEKMSTALKQTAKDFGELECRLVLYSSPQCMNTPLGGWEEGGGNSLFYCRNKFRHQV